MKVFCSLLALGLLSLSACRKSSDEGSSATAPVTIVGGSGTATTPGTGTAPTSMADLAKIYFQSATTIEMEVWYEAAAKPYEKRFTDGTYWSTLRKNLNELFQYRSAPPTLDVPDGTSDMHLLDITKQENWTATQILALAAAHNTGTAASGISRFQVYFLDGYFNAGEGSNKQVLGVHIGNSNVLAMFKPVIDGSGGEAVARFVEQSVMIHEMGHALGFVNNGVPLSSQYQDSEHGAHSSNKECVMYWQNEGASDMIAFIQKYLLTQDPVMWGAEILADAKGISR